MPHHLELLSDPIGAVRRVWQDASWRAAIIAAAAIALFELLTGAADAPVGNSVGWAACLITIVLLARAALLRPVRGNLLDTENLSVLLGISLLLIGEILISFTTLGGTFAAAPLTWPFAVLFGALPLAGRALAPHLTRPLVAWPLLYLFLYFWMTIGMWTSQAVIPEPTLTWSVAVAAFALISRGIVGRGFGGPLISPLNAATGLFIFLTIWMEYAADKSGVSADPWSYQELYWPWVVISVSLSFGSAAAAPYLVRRFGGRSGPT